MIKSVPLLAAGIVTCFVPAYARAEIDLPGDFSANATVVSEYVFRGVSQSDEHAAVQAGFDWAHPETGLYLGVWGSSVDFTDATVEIDYYGGINGTKEQFNWDLGAIYYSYPGADESLDYDFVELAGAIGYDFTLFSLSAALNYSPEYFGDTGEAVYSALYATVPLPYELSLSASAAYQWIEDGESYKDWSLGLNKTVEGFDIGLKYHDTDLQEPDECADGCDGRLVFSVGRTF